LSGRGLEGVQDACLEEISLNGLGNLLLVKAQVMYTYVKLCQYTSAEDLAQGSKVSFHFGK